MNHRAAVIGLGVMGQRMLGNMASYAGFDAVAGWDPDPGARNTAAALHPHLVMVDTPAEAIGRDDVDVVYIASPPRFHATHVSAALDAGKAVYCEKPLDVDDARAAAMVDHAERSGQVNIVNFSLASAVATTEMERQLAAGETGTIAGVDIRLHFATWPRGWQMDAAGWLSFRADGGFTREVLSHWVYLSQRLFGRVALTGAEVRYGAGDLAETHVSALMTAGEVPVTVAASVGGCGPDLVEYTVWGAQRSLRVHDWNQLYSSDGGDWNRRLADIEDPREAGYERQLINASNAVAGRPHTMPSFADALAVQRIIESILATGN